MCADPYPSMSGCSVGYALGHPIGVSVRDSIGRCIDSSISSSIGDSTVCDFSHSCVLWKGNCCEDGIGKVGGNIYSHTESFRLTAELSERDPRDLCPHTTILPTLDLPRSSDLGYSNNRRLLLGAEGGQEGPCNGS